MIDFIRRHRRKLAFAALGLGSVAAIGKYAEVKFASWQQLQTKAALSRAGREQHFEATSRTAALTLRALFPALKKAIRTKIDSNEIIERIKETPDNKAELWNELKVAAFARCLAFIYGGSALAILIKAQFNILAGKIFTDPQVPKKSQEEFLRIVSREFIDSQLEQICEFSMELSRKFVGEIGLVTKFTCNNLEDFFKEILSQKPNLNLNVKIEDESDSMLNELIDDLNDVLEISEADWIKVNESCVEVGVAAILDDLAEAFEVNNDLCPSNKAKCLPLAKIVPMLNSVVEAASEDDEDDEFCLRLNSDLNKALESFSANIYEAFSQPKPQTNIDQPAFGLKQFINLFE